MEFHDPSDIEKVALEIVRRVGRSFWNRVQGDDYEEIEDIENELGMTSEEASVIIGKRLRPH